MAVKSSPSEPILANLDGLLAELETIYKDIHSHPELEVRTAAALIKCMKDGWSLKVRLLAISDEWQEVGKGFGVEEWSIPERNGLHHHVAN